MPFMRCDAVQQAWVENCVEPRDVVDNHADNRVQNCSADKHDNHTVCGSHSAVKLWQECGPRRNIVFQQMSA